MTLKTIDITPTWNGVMPLLLAAIENGSDEGKRLAIAELRKLATIADGVIAEQKAAKPEADKPPVVSKDVSRVDREYWRVWAEEHPDLFSRSFWQFKADYPVAEWRHYVSFHGATTKLIAVRRDRPYDLDRDYLVEIGTAPAKSAADREAEFFGGPAS